MTSHEHTSTEKKLNELYELIDDMEIALMTTRRPDGQLVTRPMATQEHGRLGDLWFVTNIETHKVDELEADPNVCLGYYDDGSKEWVSVSGTARVSPGPEADPGALRARLEGLVRRRRRRPGRRSRRSPPGPHRGRRPYGDLHEEQALKAPGALRARQGHGHRGEGGARTGGAVEPGGVALTERAGSPLLAIRPAPPGRRWSPPRRSVFRRLLPLRPR